MRGLDDQDRRIALQVGCAIVGLTLIAFWLAAVAALSWRLFLTLAGLGA